MGMYVCIFYTCICVYGYVYPYIMYVCMCVHMMYVCIVYICVFVYTKLYTRVCVCVCVCVYSSLLTSLTKLILSPPPTDHFHWEHACIVEYRGEMFFCVDVCVWFKHRLQLVAALYTRPTSKKLDETTASDTVRCCH